LGGHWVEVMGGSYMVYGWGSWGEGHGLRVIEGHGWREEGTGGRVHGGMSHRMDHGYRGRAFGRDHGYMGRACGVCKNIKKPKI
jgi:hypothetical protein